MLTRCVTWLLKMFRRASFFYAIVICSGGALVSTAFFGDQRGDSTLGFGLLQVAVLTPGIFLTAAGLRLWAGMPIRHGRQYWIVGAFVVAFSLLGASTHSWVPAHWEFTRRAAIGLLFFSVLLSLIPFIGLTQLRSKVFRAASGVFLAVVSASFFLVFDEQRIDLFLLRAQRSEEQLREQVSRFEQYLGSLRQQLGYCERLESNTVPMSDEGCFDIGALSDDRLITPNRELVQLREEVIELRRERAVRNSAGKRLALEKRLPVIIHNSGFITKLAIESVTDDYFFSIENKGLELEVNPRIIVNNERGWWSARDISESILDSNSTDAEKVMSIWSFLSRNSIHGVSASGSGFHTPVKLLNVFGYGLCDDTSRNFVALTEAAGIRARVWGLNGHVVAEAFYDNSWHMFDVDKRLWFYDSVNSRIAGVEDIMSNPDIIRQNAFKVYGDGEVEGLVDLYQSEKDNAVWSHERVEESNMGFVLRPGEKLTRYTHNWGQYFSEQLSEEPKRFGNGRWIFRPVLREVLFRRSAVAADGIKHVVDDFGNAVIRSVADESNDMLGGRLIYRFLSPYPYVDAGLRVVGAGRIAIDYSDRNGDWERVVEEMFGGELRAPLGGFLENGSSSATYEYFIRITIDGEISEMEFISDVQLAPASLPSLRPGENKVEYLSESHDDINLLVTFGYY